MDAAADRLRLKFTEYWSSVMLQFYLKKTTTVFSTNCVLFREQETKRAQKVKQRTGRLKHIHECFKVSHMYI